MTRMEFEILAKSAFVCLRRGWEENKELYNQKRFILGQNLEA